MLSYVLSFLAGTLTAISPCVLPVLPLIAGSAAQEHRHAPLSLAGGMVLSFTTLGFLLATVGVSLAIDQSVVRSIAAAFIVLFGIILLVPTLQGRLQALLTPVSSLANQKLATGKFKGLFGQFGRGCMLGAVWSPCVGPTLGAAAGLASQSGGLMQATFMMFLFGIGSAIPLLFIAYGSRKLFLSNRGRILHAGKIAKPALGVVFAGAGAAILIGVDKSIEAALLNALPEAWVDLITRY